MFTFHPLSLVLGILLLVLYPKIGIKGIVFLLLLGIISLLCIVDKSIAIPVACASIVILAVCIPNYIRCYKRNMEIKKRIRLEHPDFTDEGINLLLKEELRRMKKIS